MKTLILCLGFILFAFVVPVHASLLPARCMHNDIIITDNITPMNDSKPSEEKPLVIVTDETGRTYFIFSHLLAGMSWIAGYHIPHISPF